MTEVVDLLVLAALAWPFLAGIALGAIGQGRSVSVAVPVAAVGLLLSVMAGIIAATGHGRPSMSWVDTGSVAIWGRVLVSVGLVMELLAAAPRALSSQAAAFQAGALHEEAVASGDERGEHFSRSDREKLGPALSFWGAGFTALALSLALTPVALAMLLTGSALLTVFHDGRRGAALSGWDALRRNAVGALTAIAGAAHPVAASGAVLLGAGFVILGGLFPVAPFVVEQYLRNGGRETLSSARVLSVFRFCMAAILLATVQVGSEPVSLFAPLSFALIVTGFLSVVVSAARLVSGSAAGRPMLVVSGCLGLAAIAASAGCPSAALLALMGPTLAAPWLLENGVPGRGDPVSAFLQRQAGVLLVLPAFGAVLLLTQALQAHSILLAALVVVAPFPAMARRRGAGADQAVARSGVSGFADGVER
ncbi:hypothetical protein AA23498_2576 [Acetobacter nitrogenifigens DSM 23921 = NBRC 105050]|uniref:Uncharacterized protein n=1 Tax=Acetobacter nitrogenifigens DSM 23921 = NBRC 105050 TaxID=1120919 RepID=A0A511X636_9PROT|nr:hypothetical protein [Acetobacter nitrogenifigens]GBQ96208.1 hypothetical protein AA23498_2576 [Acetobacter nitrogenifigens DSM 23921 = NBRC 105050]GEN58407.1 hypothetical protein ANI02nite_02910 [Acetobacter nitrogenifigens DSM 23921 = NBRC 105050]